MRTASERVGRQRAMIDSALVATNVSIPAAVVSVNNDRVNVIPAINKVRMLPDGTKQYEPTAEIEDVPVINLSCGDFSISMPLQVGCNGLLIFCDYDIDGWLAGNPNPPTDRYHDQNDCFFLPAFNGGRNDGDCLELASRNVTLKICNDGFDVEYNGTSLIDSINDAFASCCNGNRPLDGWKP